MKDGSDPIWNIYRSGQPKAHDTPPAPLPNPSHDMEYAAYCEGVAAQLAGNSNIPQPGTVMSYRQIAAHALGRLDAQAQLAYIPTVCLRTQASLVAELDKLFAPPVAPSAT